MRTLVLSIPLVASCFAYSKVPPERPAPELRKLADAQILDMTIDLNKQPGLCPGKEGKLYAKAKVVWPGGKPIDRWIGNDVDSLSPLSFAITGPLITGDKDAHLHPSADVLASVETGFSAKVVYKPIPKYTFDPVFKPEYSCFTGWWDAGTAGAGGAQGDGGGAPRDFGAHGQDGGPGRAGSPGMRGGKVVAYVTFVSTKYYPKLLAVWANDHFFLAPPDVPITFGAPGGAGGQGGFGGNGGAGGNQRTESQERWDPDAKETVTKIVGVGGVGNGGRGGSGASGARGGDGGHVEVTLDAKFERELGPLVLIDVGGGAGGAPGGGGDGGAGGDSDAEISEQYGSPGAGGAAGAEAGRPGNSGTKRVTRANLDGKFRLRGITIYRGRR